MQLTKLEELFKMIDDCKHLYNEMILPEKRGFKSKLAELRKMLTDVRNKIAAAKKESILRKEQD